MNIKRSIRVQWLRLLKISDNLGMTIIKAPDLSEQQKMGISIFERTLSLKDTEIHLSPLNDIIYIEINDIYIILDGNDLQIINGKFQYNLHYGDTIRMRLKTRVYNVLEGRIDKVEKTIRAKRSRTLSSIMEDIKEIKEKETIQ